jgi:putative transposase
VQGQWKYLYRAVDKAGDTVDFLFRAKRDKAAARRYFEKAIAGNDVPQMVTIDKSGANLAGLNAINTDREIPIKIRQSKYLNNVVEQDHRAGPSSDQTHRTTNARIQELSLRPRHLGGIEPMHMIAKGQMKSDGGRHRSVAEQFYDLAK